MKENKYHLSEEVIIANIKDCPEYYKKYINQHGLINFIDAFSHKNKVIYGIIFNDDDVLHDKLYQSSNPIYFRPTIVKFYEENIALKS